MSRTAINTIENIFKRLESMISPEDRTKIIIAKRRVIKHPEYSESNQDVIERSIFGSKIVLHSSKIIAGMIYKGRHFVIIPEISNLNEDFATGISHNVLLVDDTISDGLILTIISEDIITIKEYGDLSLQLVDKIFGLEPMQGKIDYSVFDIKYFFNDFEVWEVDPQYYDVKQEEDLYRLISAYQLNKRITDEPSTVILKFEAETVVNICDLLTTQCSQFISHVIYKAVTSNHWEHCFLEFYRCIENLYLVYHIDSLTNQLTVDSSKIASGLDIIGFRSTERTDIKKLFAKLSISVQKLEELKTYLNQSLPTEQEAQEQERNVDYEKLKEKMADKIYDIRCSIAHLKYKHNYPEFDEKGWNILISALCVVIRELYGVYNGCLSRIVRT